MKIDFSKKIKALNGEPFTYLKGKKELPLTLGVAVIQSLTTTLSPQLSRIDVDVPGEVKFKRYKLASKIAEATEPVDMNIDDTKLIKDRVGEVCDPEVIGAVWNILDPQE